MTNDVLAGAIALAATAHAGQRHGRDTQIEHCLRVMMQMDAVDEKVVAVLHDVIEDTDTTIQLLNALGYEDHVVKAIALLTHHADEDYLTYVRKLRPNALARKVKLADNWDNGSTIFDSGLPLVMISRLVKRYALARRILNFEED